MAVLLLWYLSATNCTCGNHINAGAFCYLQRFILVCLYIGRLALVFSCGLAAYVAIFRVTTLWQCGYSHGLETI